MATTADRTDWASCAQRAAAVRTSTGRAARDAIWPESPAFSWRLTACGWFNLTGELVLWLASLLFGALYQGAGAPAAFGVSAACALAAA
jgi:hypothetical protein